MDWNTLMNGPRVHAEASSREPEMNAKAIQTFLEMLMPTTPEDVAMTVAGGPAAKLGGAAALGMLKRVPWEKAATRLPDLQPYADQIKRAMESRLKATNQTGLEHGFTGSIQPDGKYSIRRSVGDNTSIEVDHVRNWPGNRWNENPQQAYNKAATTHFHTHPGESRMQVGGDARPSSADMDVWKETGGLVVPRPATPGRYGNTYMTPDDQVMRVPGAMRGNQENVILAPNNEYFWWSLPKDVSAQKLKPIQFEDNYWKGVPATRDETFARILYGAKKGDWDVQTTLDTLLWGVKP